MAVCVRRICPASKQGTTKEGGKEGRKEGVAPTGQQGPLLRPLSPNIRVGGALAKDSATQPPPGPRQSLLPQVNTAFPSRHALQRLVSMCCHIDMSLRLSFAAD